VIDSHCHLDFNDFNVDRVCVLERCQRLGVTHIVMPGVSMAQWHTLTTLVNQHAQLRFSVGIHPWFLDDQSLVLSDLLICKEQLLAAMVPFLHHQQCCALGECGLDKVKARNQAEWLQQQVVFEAHCLIAKELDLPLIIHSVKSHDMVLTYLKKYDLRRGVIHAFHGSTEQALAFYKQGFLLGAGGGITYDRAKKTRAAFAALPLEAIVLETDAPSMPVSGQQGERNSPESTPVIAKHLADIKGDDLKYVIQQTRHNTLLLFGID